MSNKFQVEINAQDNTSAVLDRIADSVDRLNQSTSRSSQQQQRNTRENQRNNQELTRTQKIMERIKRASAVGQRLGRGTIIGEAAGGVGRIASDTGALDASISGLSRSMGALSASMAAITVYGVKQAIKWADDAQSMDNFAHSVGMGVDVLQKWQGAAKLAGISQDAMMSNIQQFGTTVRQSLIGQNAQAAMAFKQLGVQVEYGKDGIVDYNKALLDSVRALDKLKSPQLRAAAAEILGLSALIPVLGRGDNRVENLLKRTTETGAVRPTEQVKQAAKSAVEVNAAKMAGKGAERNIADTFMGLTEKGANVFENIMSQIAGNGPYQRMIDTPSPDASRIYVPNRGFVPLKKWREEQESGKQTTEKPEAPSRIYIPNRGFVPTEQWKKEQSEKRGIRQNNPMNLRSWEGYPQKGGFAQFPSMDVGLQKGAIQLRRYGARGIDSLNEIVNTFAPPKENNTDKYINDLSRMTGFKPDDKLNLNDAKTLERLITAKSQLETGFKPSQQQSTAAVNQAMQVNIQVNAPSGTTATATVTTADGQNLKPRISHSMPMYPE